MGKYITGIVLLAMVVGPLYGLSGAYAKSASQQGLAAGYFLLAIAMGCVTIALSVFLFLFLFDAERSSSIAGFNHAYLSGLSWASGAAVVVFVLTFCNVEGSHAFSVSNGSTLLFGALMCLILLNEWDRVQLDRLSIGLLVIFIGVIVVGTAGRPIAK